ncbi:MAG TPA: CDP-alcohol phosphatidyltransferase family protein [Pyrinomonadaceae bacterium]|nr:CDP-alcohol phosphatidyltransferase family protein [Pyrinomonadaceae bacterium]
MVNECVILADSPGALTELCGISTLERLLRTLQRCGIKRATILSSTPDPVAKELARPSWARAQLNLKVRTRPDGPVKLDQIIDIWPRNSKATPLLLVVPADSVFDPRLLRALVSQGAPAALVDSGVRRPNLQTLIALAPDSPRGKLCGPVLLEYDWASAQDGLLEESLRNGLEHDTLAALDVSTQPSYYVSIHRKLRPFWFPAPSLSNRKLAKRVLFDSIQKGPPDIPAWVHAPIETFLVSRLCKTPITPNQLTLFCNVVAWTVTVLLVTGHVAWGLGLALVVGVLDGLDGKQARVKLETSNAGKLEHFFDALFENSWWLALAWHLSVSGKLPDAFSYLGLLIGAEVLNALARASIVRYYGKSISELGRFDRIFRLVGGRRNIYVWILALGLILGPVAGAFKLIAWWEAVTAAVHLARAAWAQWALRSQSAAG